MSRLSNGKPHLPLNLAESGLNLRAFLELPPRGVSLEDEVKSVINAARTRLTSPEEATQAILRIIGRETGQFEDAVRRALGEG
jgi:hypothetical protein